jgi:hypothetical protein
MGAVGLLRAPVAMEDVADAARFLLVIGALPWPVRSGEMQAHHEGGARTRVEFDGLHSAIAEQVGHVAVPLDGHFLLMQLVGLGAVASGIGPVVEIVGGAAQDSEEAVVAALERAEIRQEAEMPFADQRGAVACLAKQRRQRGMIGRQADVLRRYGVDRLLQADREAILVAAGDQRGARGRADRGIGVALGEAHSLKREPVDVRGEIVALAVAAHVGVAEIVRHDEDDVWLGRLRAQRAAEAHAGKRE